MEETWSRNLKDLLAKLFVKDPAVRVKNIEKLKEHPWFAMIEWEEIQSKSMKAPFVPVLKREEDVSNFDKKFTKCSYESHAESCEDGHLPGFSYEAETA